MRPVVALGEVALLVPSVADVGEVEPGADLLHAGAAVVEVAEGAVAAAVAQVACARQLNCVTRDRIGNKVKSD